jgi:hypothetical protein
VLTRTIWVSCLSRFLLLLLHVRQISSGCCTQTRSSAHNLKSYTKTIICLRDKFVPRPLRHSLLQSYLPGEITSHYQTCAATAPTRNRPYAMTAKTRAIPALHREKDLAKVPGQVNGASLGNTTSPYCRAVSIHASCDSIGNLLKRDKYILSISTNANSKI